MDGWTDRQTDKKIQIDEVKMDGDRHSQTYIDLDRSGMNGLGINMQVQTEREIYIYIQIGIHKQNNQRQIKKQTQTGIDRQKHICVAFDQYTVDRCRNNQIIVDEYSQGQMEMAKDRKDIYIQMDQNRRDRSRLREREREREIET